MAKGDDCPRRWANMIVAGSFVLGHQRIDREIMEPERWQRTWVPQSNLALPYETVEAACVPRSPSTRGSMQVSLGGSHMKQGPSHFN